jgi:hypothetical protein
MPVKVNEVVGMITVTLLCILSKGAAILNISQYCHYLEDSENKFVADKERSIVLTYSVYFTAASSTFEVVLYCPF